MTEDELKETSPKEAYEVLKSDPKASGGCRAPNEGETVKNPLLAKTFQLLAEKGKEGFYEGPIAEAIVEASRSRGGFLTLEDLKYHAEKGSEIGPGMSLKLGQSDGTEAKGNSVNGVELWEHPPNGQGIVALMALGIMQELERSGVIRSLAEMKHNSTE